MLVEHLLRDVALAFRLFRRTPTYALTALLTLALGLATTTAIFAVIDATLLRPLPFADPGRLVSLNSMMPDAGGKEIQFALTEIEIVRWREGTRMLEGIEAVGPKSFAFTGSGEPAVVRGAAITSGLIPTLGVAPLRGRVFTAEEERRRAPVAVLGYGEWQRRFSGSDAALGQSITLDGRSYEIVGVMPAGFHPLLDASEIWIPLSPQINPQQAKNRLTAGVARLKPGASTAQAEPELGATSAVLAREFPTGHAKARPQVIGLRENLLGQQRPALVALGAGVLLLLLLACANVANLTLGHLAGRRTELTMRTLLGASKWRLIQQQLVQSVVVSAAGGGLGLAIVAWTLPMVLALYRRDGTAAADVRIDWRVLAFSAVGIIVTGIASGVVPALKFQRASEDQLGSLSVMRVGSGRRERRARGVLVVLQVAMAVALLCGAGTLLVSFERLLAAPTGFDADGVLTMQLMLPPAKYGDVPSRAAFVQQMLERVSAIPGVVSAGTTQTTFMPGESMQTFLFVEGRPVDQASPETVNIRHVTPGYFKTLRVPIEDGRAIEDRDRLGTPMVCVVSADFARQYWPHESAIGHRIRRASAAAQWMTIVGVAADVADAGAGVKAGKTLYVSYLQQNTPTARVTLVAWTRGDPLASAQAVRQAIWSVDPNQPIDRVGRLTDQIVTSAGNERFRTLLLAIFAVSGLLLALVGVYGVAAASVAARRWEAGVRLALGARPRSLVVTMLCETTASVAAGASAGVVLFLGSGRLLAGLLYQTAIADTRVMAAAVALMVAGAIGAAWLQARRIATVSPTVALREN